MSDNTLATKITADIADLQAKYAVAKAEVSALTAEMSKLAKQSAAGVLDEAGMAQLQGVAGQFLEAKNAAAELSKELKGTHDESASLGGALEEIRGKIGSAFEITGIAAAYEAVRMVGEAIEQLGARAVEIHSLSDILGVSVEQFQAMQLAAEEGGTSVEVFTRAGERLITTLAAARDGSGAAVTKLKDLGITTEQIADPAFQLNDVFQSLHDQLTNTATKQDTMNQLIKEFGPRAALAAEALIHYDGSAKGVADVTDRLNGLNTEQVKGLMEAKAWWSELGTEIANTSSKLLVWTTAALKAADASNEWSTGGTLQVPDLTQESVDAGAQQRKVQEAKAAADQQRALQVEIDEQGLESIKAGEEAFAQGTEARIAQMHLYATAAAKFYGSDTVDIVVKANQAVVSEERELTQRRKAFLDEWESYYSATTDRIRNDSLRFQTQEDQANSRQAALEKRTIDEMLDYWAKYHIKLTNMKAQGVEELNRLNAKIVTDFEKAMQPMQRVFETTTMGLIRGTENWHQAFLHVLDGMLQNFVHWAAQTLVHHVAIEEAKSLSTAAGAATRAATEESASAESLLMHGAMALKQIANDAAKAAAATFQSVAQIPYVGYILAPAAAAAAFAAVAAFGGSIASAEGGFDIPTGVNPVTQLHQGEMVLPRPIADPLRDMISSGGGGGKTNTVQFTPAPNGHGLIHMGNLAGALRQLGLQFKLAR